MGVKKYFTFSKIEKIISISIFVNIALGLLKVITGLLGSSVALLADGIHSFSDLTNDVIAIIGNRFAKKPPDNKHPLGHGKSEYLTSIIIGLFIILIGTFFIKEMFYKEITYPKKIIIIVSGITILIKLWVANFLIKKGEKHQNNILIASGKESSSDVFVSLIVLISAVGVQLVAKYNILKYSDKIASIIVGIFIIKVGFDIIKINASMVIGEQVIDKDYLNNIQKIILHDKDIKVIRELVILKYGPDFKLISEIEMKSNLSLLKVHNKIKVIENRIKTYDQKINYIKIKGSPFFKKG